MNIKNPSMLMLLALALPACSYHGHDGRGAEYGYTNDSEGTPQYRSHDEESREYNEVTQEDNEGYMYDQHKHKLSAAVDHFFAKVDSNHDGYISRREFDAHMHKKFDEMDTNHDGKLSREEVMAWKRKEMHEMHAEKGSDSRSNRYSDHDRSDMSDNRQYEDMAPQE